MVFLTANHDTPMYYTVKANETNDLCKKEKFINKRNQILAKFYKYEEELQYEMDHLDKTVAELDHKSTEKSFWQLIKINCLSKKTRWSFIAVMAFMTWAPMSGLTYAQSYMTTIFDKLVYDGFGYKLTFYSGFCCIAGSVCGLFLVERVNRLTLLCGCQLIISICMWLLAFAFYFNFVNFAVAINLVFVFTLYLGIHGVTYAFVNELSEPFVVGCSFGWAWVLISI